MHGGSARLTVLVVRGPATVPLPRFHISAAAADALVFLVSALAARAGIDCRVEGRTRHAA